ncbi:hypothetical protein L596_010586 [Steinernema carpocapsae]|uniref:Granulins domain-containing protein n=1 Tax=Steinernema carpocapsae TaxID=34508 RepID=A0A4V6A712_STECR|nr:hypothetical protein L596_010586 [Steinernema carpocapsae]
MKTLVSLVLLFAFAAVVHSQTCRPGQTRCIGCTNYPTCCPLPNAFCCRSGLRCCPAGSICSLDERFCIRFNLAGEEIRTPVASSSALLEDVLTRNAQAN